MATGWIDPARQQTPVTGASTGMGSFGLGGGGSAAANPGRGGGSAPSGRGGGGSNAPVTMTSPGFTPQARAGTAQDYARQTGAELGGLQAARPATGGGGGGSNQALESLESELAGLDEQIAGLQAEIENANANPELDWSGYEAYQDQLRDTFETDPGYEFRQEEGLRALDRSAAARGRLLSGAQQRDVQRFGQGLASAEFGGHVDRVNQYANRLAGIAGVGQTATTQTGQFGQNFANQAGQNMMAGANASAAGTVGASNAWNEGIGNAMFSMNQSGMFDQMGSAFGGGGSGGGSGIFVGSGIVPPSSFMSV